MGLLLQADGGGLRIRNGRVSGHVSRLQDEVSASRKAAGRPADAVREVQQKVSRGQSAAFGDRATFAVGRFVLVAQEEPTTLPGFATAGRFAFSFLGARSFAA